MEGPFGGHPPSAATLAITWLTARGGRSRDGFYRGDGTLSAFRNGLAIAGDYMSAAAFLGVSGLITVGGFDGMLYGVGFVMGWPVVLFLVAERLRRLGRFNFGCALAHRLSERPVRIFAACSSLIVIAFDLIARMVGAGQSVELLFGIDYAYAVVLVGVLMTCYVMFGGMLATTWIQIVKATLLLASAALLTVLTPARFGFHEIMQGPRHVSSFPTVTVRADELDGMDYWQLDDAGLIGEMTVLWRPLPAILAVQKRLAA